MEGSTTSKFVDLPLTERVGLIGLYAFLLFAWEGKGKAAIRVYAGSCPLPAGPSFLA